MTNSQGKVAELPVAATVNQPDTVSWAFHPANAADVAGWGFWIGIIGLFLTVVGFAATIRQVRQTKSIAQAAKDESERIQGALRHYDAVQEATRAAYALSAARKHFRNGAWADGSENYDDFRRSLSSLKNNCDYLAHDIIDRMDSATTYILRLCERIDKSAANSYSKLDYAKVAAVMRQHDQLIDDIANFVQRGSFK